MATGVGLLWQGVTPIPLENLRNKRRSKLQSGRPHESTLETVASRSSGSRRSVASGESQLSLSSHDTPPLESVRPADGSVGHKAPPTNQAAHQLAVYPSSPGSSPHPHPPLRLHASLNSTPQSQLDPRHAHGQAHSAAGKHSFGAKQMPNFSLRKDSFSTASGTASLSTHTMTSTSATNSRDSLSSKPFVLRNGRTFLSDPTLSYPLPTDLTELHRQSMRTLLFIQIHGAPFCSSVPNKRTPLKVLEIGCGSGFWSMMCHRYFKARGHGDISYTGIDIAPLSPKGSGGNKPDPEMKWNFVQHDLRQVPWPLPSDEFDLVMAKDLTLTLAHKSYQGFIDESIRVLRPGGALEFWDSDHLIRMLRPRVMDSKVTGDDAEEHEAAAQLGAYVINANTPLTAPLNPYLVDYNQWLSKALEMRDLTPVPCTIIGPTLIQESDTLTDIKSRRLALPLCDVRWEREGIGNGSDQKEKGTGQRPERRQLTAGQVALRQTALFTVVQQVQALESILREVSGKSQDEWDLWLGKMMADLMSESGAHWGECLEIGAWWAIKRKTPLA